MCSRALHDAGNLARSATAWDELTLTEKWQFLEAILRDSRLTLVEKFYRDHSLPYRTTKV